MVRKKQKWKNISVPVWLKEELEKDKENFEKNIGDGKWSIADVIIEYRKMIGKEGLEFKGL